MIGPTTRSCRSLSEESVSRLFVHSRTNWECKRPWVSGIQPGSQAMAMPRTSTAAESWRSSTDPTALRVHARMHWIHRPGVRAIPWIPVSILRHQVRRCPQRPESRHRRPGDWATRLVPVHRVLRALRSVDRGPAPHQPSRKAPDASVR